MASELNLNMRSDGYVKVEDLLKLNMKTFANIQLRSHTIDDVREVGYANSLPYYISSIDSYSYTLCVHTPIHKIPRCFIGLVGKPFVFFSFNVVKNYSPFYIS